MENIPDMKADILFGYLVEFRDECLGEPDCSFFKPDLNAAWVTGSGTGLSFNHSPPSLT
jgi:hypothetical protein